MFFANPLLLFGLVAVLIPPAVHFFSRRRYDEVDWGAMQFLRLAPKARRKVWLDQWLLLALRMAALGLLAAALAGPSVRSPFFNRFDPPAPRTTVVLIDASGSMARHTDAARAWATRFLDQMRPGDRVALFAVKGDVVPLLATPTAEREQAKAALELLPPARGTADWPAAIEAAVRTPDVSEILVLSDDQRFGWADAQTLSRWDALARKQTLPPVWVVNVAPDNPTDMPDIASFRANRVVTTIGSEVRFDGRVVRREPHIKLRLAVDGRSAGEITPSADGAFTFGRKFPLGSHLVSVALGDHEPHGIAVDVVPPHGVLIVEGEPAGDVLGRALSPANDPAPAFVPRTLPLARFTPSALMAATKLLILANVPKLTTEQDAAVARFAADGGGVLVALGDRTEAAAWNRQAHRGGRGWLPAAVLEPVTTGEARPRTTAIDHPALHLFRPDLPGGLQTATFPRYWKLKPDAGAMMSLTTGDALLAEKAVGRGRVVLSAVPFDASGDSNLIRLPDFVPLVHELAHHLAGGSFPDANVSPGEPLVFRPRDTEPPGPVTVVPPDGTPRVVPVKAWPATFDATRDPGPYRVSTASGESRYFVVKPDPREADRTRPTDAERARVAGLLGKAEDVTTLDELTTRRGRGPATLDFGDALLIVVLALFAAELWYTRRSANAGA